MAVRRAQAQSSEYVNPDEREALARQSELVVYRHLHDENHPAKGEAPKRVTLDELCARHPNVDVLMVENHPEGVNEVPLEKLRSLPFWPGQPACDPRLSPPEIISGAESAVRIKDPRRKDVHQHVGIVGLSAEQQVFLQEWLKRDGKSYLLIGGDLGPELAAYVHALGGYIVYNHPDWRPSERGLNYKLTDAEASAVDAVEVANDLSFSGIDAGEVLRWTEENFFQRGFFPAVVSGLDEHGPDFTTKTPTATVVVRREEGGRKNAVLHGIGDAATYLTRSRSFTLDMSVDGEHGLGDHPTFAEGSQHEARVFLRHLPVGARVQVIVNGKVAHEETVRLNQRAGTARDIDVHVPFAAKTFGDIGQGYMYVRVDSPAAPGGQRSLLMATSAIPFNVVCGEP